MRVSPISACNRTQSNLKNSCKPHLYANSISFKRSLECTKFFALICGIVAAASGIGKTIKAEGEISVPKTLVYAACGTLLGAALGNKIDNDLDNDGLNKSA